MKNQKQIREIKINYKLSSMSLALSKIIYLLFSLIKILKIKAFLNIVHKTVKCHTKQGLK